MQQMHKPRCCDENLMIRILACEGVSKNTMTPYRQMLEPPGAVTVEAKLWIGQIKKIR